MTRARRAVVAAMLAVLALAGPSQEVEVRHPSCAVLRLLGVLSQAGAGVHVGRAPGPQAALVLRDDSAPRR